MKALRLAIVAFFGPLLLVSCSFTPNQNPTQTPTPSPTPTLLSSVTGEKCEIKDQLFSSQGRTDFDECEIRKNSELFNGKTIRIKSGYGFMIHGSYLFSENCSLSESIDNWISVGLEEKDWKYLQALKSLPADIVAVGIFSVSEPSNESDTIYDRTPYHFSISCLEKGIARPKK